MMSCAVNSGHERAHQQTNGNGRNGVRIFSTRWMIYSKVISFLHVYNTLPIYMINMIYSQYARSLVFFFLNKLKSQVSDRLLPSHEPIQMMPAKPPSKVGSRSCHSQPCYPCTCYICPCQLCPCHLCYCHPRLCPPCHHWLLCRSKASCYLESFCSFWLLSYLPLSPCPPCHHWLFCRSSACKELI